MFNPGANLYSAAFGTVPAGPNFPVYFTAAPTAQTVQGPFGTFVPGQIGLVQNTGIYGLLGFSTAGDILSANWVQLANSSGSVIPSGTFTTNGSIYATGTNTVASTAAGTNGQVLIAATGGAPAFATIANGNGIATQLGANSLTINNKTAGYNENVVAGATQAMAAQQMYICTNAGQTTLTLPATAAPGDSFLVIGSPANTGGWIIAQNSGQTIHNGATASTTGATGNATSAAHANESIMITCTVANTDFCQMFANGTVTLN
jgi:hypothetical protein